MNPVSHRKLIAYVCFLFLWFSGTVYSTEAGSFAIIGDTRIGLTEEHYADFIRIVQAQGIGLIVHTGDVIHQPGNESQWRRFLEITGKNTILVAPGNHDLKDTKSLQVYEKLIQRPPYFSFSFGDTQMIILCSELPGEPGRIAGKQLQWLSDELKKPFQYRLVFIHRPLFPVTYHKSYSLDRYTKDRDALHGLFIKHKVNIVIAGHEHVYNRMTKDGILYVITGGGGAPLHAFTQEQGGFFHYIIAKKGKEGYVLKVYDFDRKLHDEFQIKNEVRNGKCSKMEKKEDQEA
jgi:predicted phosphodiesterase